MKTRNFKRNGMQMCGDFLPMHERSSACKTDLSSTMCCQSPRPYPHQLSAVAGGEVLIANGQKCDRNPN